MNTPIQDFNNTHFHSHLYKRAPERAKLLAEPPREAVQQNNLFCSGRPLLLSHSVVTRHSPIDENKASLYAPATTNVFTIYTFCQSRRRSIAQYLSAGACLMGILVFLYIAAAVVIPCLVYRDYIRAGSRADFATAKFFRPLDRVSEKVPLLRVTLTDVSQIALAIIPEHRSR